MEISLDNVKMNVLQTAEQGVVNQDTIFVFRQIGSQVSAEYSGGKISKGYLIGLMVNDKLTFSYCQLQVNGKLDCGISTCEISRDEHHKIKLEEHFEWASRPGEKGTNIFVEI